MKKDLFPAETLASDSACIIDSMAIVQKAMAGITNATSGEASETIFSLILKEGRDSIRIDVIKKIPSKMLRRYKEDLTEPLTD